MTMTIETRRASVHIALLGALVGVLASASAARAANDCAVPAGDFCVCCPPSDCRKEDAFCPGGAGGLLVLKAKNPSCAVNPFDATRCRSGGIIATEQTSALGIYAQGHRARVELSQQQLDALVGQLEKLRR